MSVLDLIGIKASLLPPDMQQEVLDFVEFLNVKKSRKKSENELYPRLPNARGAGKGLVTYISDDFDAPLTYIRDKLLTQ
ncbi:DUF2281 domain-containing protein [Runella sp.]|uniref:DUF2281 domain-containing protein n=1 Tax=Runella sp. TaxID=1960881 RepID=UPI003D0982C4